MKHLLSIKSWKIFLILIVFFLLFTYADSLFLTDNLYYKSLGDQLALERIAEMLEKSKKLNWLMYIFLPVLVLLRVFYTSVFLFIGIFFTEQKIEYGKIFKVALLADFVFVLSALVRLVMFIFFVEVSSLEDFGLQPFSVLGLIDQNSVEPMFLYPLTRANLFQFIYFFVLAALLKGSIYEPNTKKISYWKSLKLVIISYGSGLLLWILFIMFFTLNTY